MFWNKLAWKAGFLYKGAGAEYKSMVGVPLGLSYRTGSLTFSEALEYSARHAAYDSVRRTIGGNLDGLGRDLLADLLLILFRRSELFIGLTPGYYMGDRLFADGTPGSRFHLSVDAGVVLSIPSGGWPSTSLRAITIFSRRNLTANGSLSGITFPSRSAWPVFFNLMIVGYFRYP